MGIPKQSRKGKKAWRKNIDASEIETFLEAEGHKQQREPAVATLKDEDLFVVDKAADDDAVPAAVRKHKKEPKPLKSQLILDSLRDGITAVPQGAKRKAKGAGKPLPNSTAAAGQQQQQAVVVAPPKKKQKRRRGAVSLSDIWADEPVQQQHEQDWTKHKSGNELEGLAKLKQQQQQQQQLADTAAAAAAAAASKGKSRKRPAPIPAVEVDLPGCSFNPEYEAHQDALAVAVAAEYKKQLKQELAPTAPSLFAPAGYKPGDELDELLADAEADEDDEQQQQQLSHAAAAAAATKDENAIAIDDEEDADAAAENNTGAGINNSVNDKDGLEFTAGKSPATAAAAASRKTRKDRNKEARRKQQEVEADAKRQLKRQRQRQQLEALPQLQQQLEAEDAEKEASRKRREVVKQEKAAIQPPRLGKHKFEAPAPEVLTSDQVTGSLRQLQPCFLVTEDRFKALQKRGLIEPRKAAGKKQGRKVEYVTGERREKAEARQHEVREMAAARKKAAKGGAAGAAALAALAGQSGGGGAGKKGGKKQSGAPVHQMSLAVGGDGGAEW